MFEDSIACDQTEKIEDNKQSKNTDEIIPKLQTAPTQVSASEATTEKSSTIKTASSIVNLQDGDLHLQK